MERDLFLVVLAMLTVVSGIALLVMAARRRRDARGEREDGALVAEREGRTDDEPRDGEDGEDGDGASDGRRRIDDYAIPVSFERAGDELDKDEPDISKICPRCGRRYGSHHRICERDNSELAALN